MVICNNCGVLYTDMDLVILEELEEFFKGCPDCQTDAYLADITLEEEF